MDYSAEYIDDAGPDEVSQEPTQDLAERWFQGVHGNVTHHDVFYALQVVAVEQHIRATTEVCLLVLC